MALFGKGYRFTGRAITAILAELHLHKGQIPPVLSNEVDLPHAAPEISCYNPPALGLEPLRHLILTPLPQGAGTSPAPHRFFKKERRWIGQGPNFRSNSKWRLVG